jgi:hypothetical protein
VTERIKKSLKTDYENLVHVYLEAQIRTWPLGMNVGTTLGHAMEMDNPIVFLFL